MKVHAAFDTFQTVVNASPDAVKEARRRRDLFRTALGTESDVVDVRVSGSLARGTQHDPIKDVDTVVVFDEEAHPDWGSAGDSAADALAYLGGRVNALMGGNGSHSPGEVRLASPRDHAVKCFLDDPDADAPFTVDAMPALIRPEGILVPEVHSRDWVLTDPAYLIEQAKLAHAAGGLYAPLVRILKRWAKQQVPTKVRSLFIEVLALELLPRSGSRSAALSAFFTAAAVRIDTPVLDPAGLCGPIQPDIDVAVLRGALDEAADIAASAVMHERWDQQDVAVTKWGLIFGSEFPKPPSTGGGAGGTAGAGAAGAAELVKPRPVKDINQG
jgi:hypothetical protein